MAGAAHPSRAEIAAGQLAQLRSLVAELFPANPFYTRKLQAAGVAFDIASLEDFSKRFPFTTKQELVGDQRHHPPYGTNLTYPLADYTRCHQTSGTSGVPLRWLDTPESWDWMVESWMKIFDAAGVERGDRIFFAFSFGPFIGFWLAFEAAARIGCLCLPGGGLSSESRLRAMIDNQATVLCCTPTYAMRLAEVAAKENIDLTLAKVETIIVAGEPGGSILATRNRLTELWHGARIFDHHGMTEVGPVTYECPQRPGVLHVLESAYFAEVIDPASGRHVSAGQNGELVLTTLGRTGSPLLRYRTGDLVKCGARNAEHGTLCACGRIELALEGGILGRTDDMVVVRGVNVYPTAVEEIVQASGEVAEYQVHINTAHSLVELSVQMEPVANCRDVAALARKLEKGFDKAFALRVPVTAVSPGTLPRFEMKSKRWVRSST
ncbi:MAG: AMP-binding protein [Verrucomicrobia bacterium]|nr:AMP-binding protein [Verrucomicrobiota bacterium]